jgi:hypothetical protein
VTLANSNTVSGFNVLVQDGHGLAGDGIANLFASQNTFVATNPNFDGINLIDPSGQVFVSNSSFSGFSCTNGGNNGNGIYVELDSSTLPFITVIGSQFSDISDPSSGNGGSGIALNVNGGALNTAMVSDCNFSNLTNDGVGIYTSTNAGILNTVMVSGCNFSNLTDFSNAIESFNSSTINNFYIWNCSFDNLNSSWGVYSEADNGVIDNLSVSNCIFSNSSGVVSAIETEIFGGNIDRLTLSNNIFENMNLAPAASVCFIQLSSSGTINLCNVSGNSFSTPSSSNLLFVARPSFASNMSLQVLDNTFVGSSNITTGYGASIEVSSGTVCLEFIGNSASPPNNPTPYVFINSGGTFNRTVGSDNTTNIGQFEIIGAVGAPGSCSE